MGYDGAVDLLQVKSFITSFSGSGLYIVERLVRMQMQRVLVIFKLCDIIDV